MPTLTASLHASPAQAALTVSAATGVDVAIVHADVARLGCRDARHCDGQEGRSAKDPVTHKI